MKVLVLTVSKFNGHELWVGLGHLVKRDHEFVLASTADVLVDETTGKYTRSQVLFDDLESFDEYDGLMVVSGDPKETGKLWTNPKIEQIVNEFSERPVAAICAAVPAIRSITEGKRVAFYPLVRARQLLRDSGAILTTLSLCVDGNLVTAESQARSMDWAEYFCDMLEGKEINFELKDSGHLPMGRPRRPVPEVERLKKTST